MPRTRTCGVYAIRSIKNGKVYVGSSISLEQRKQTHFTALRKNRHYRRELQEDWNTFGESGFRFETLEMCEPVDRINLELAWINYFKSQNPRYGYNVRDPRMTSMAESSRKKISQSMRGLNTWTAGVPRPQWVRDKISKSSRGHTKSAETKSRMRACRLGAKNPMSKLTDAQRANLLQDRFGKNLSYAVLRKIYGITRSGAQSLVSRHKHELQSE